MVGANPKSFMVDLDLVAWIFLGEGVKNEKNAVKDNYCEQTKECCGSSVVDRRGEWISDLKLLTGSAL